MWTREILGFSVYQLVASFVIYSMLGWLLESTYMSFCNRRLTNRGFTFLPFCPIYGVGGVVGNLLLSPLAKWPILLYLAGAIVATFFEFLVAKLMLKLFGEVWWDYRDKPFNYQGIICLESTAAWGFYAVGIVFFLNRQVIAFIDRYSFSFVVMACKMILFVVSVDFVYHLILALGINLKEYREKIVDKYQSFKARWY